MKLTWTTETSTGLQHECTLDPDHPAHQDNMNVMSPLQRAILRAYLLAVVETLAEAEARRYDSR